LAAGNRSDQIGIKAFHEDQHSVGSPVQAADKMVFRKCARGRVAARQLVIMVQKHDETMIVTSYLRGRKAKKVDMKTKNLAQSCARFRIA